MKIYLEDNESLPAVKVLQDSDPAPSGYTLVSDIVDFWKYGKSTTCDNEPSWTDQICFRSELKTMIYTKMGVTVPADANDPAKWALLSDAEKIIACDYFVVGNEIFFTEVKDDPRYWIISAGEYRNWTQKVRNDRANLCEAIIFLRMLNVGDAKQILADLNQIAKDTVLDIDETTKKLKGKAKVKRMQSMYIEGLEDEEHDGVVAIKDWIQSTVGTPFENNGFMNLTYPLQDGHTYQGVSDELCSVLDGTF